MNFLDLDFILQAQTKASYQIVSTVVNGMTDKEYNTIPVFTCTEEQLRIVKSHAVCDIAQREYDNYSSGKPYFDLYYVAPTLFRVFNENKEKKINE